MSTPHTPREKLEVESSQAREARLGNLLSSISSPSAHSPNNPALSTPPNPIPSKPSAVPESDVLAKARAFLPLLKASNNELLARAAENPDSVDMEKINGGQAIAMDLGLGLFDAPQESKSDLGPIVDTQPPAGLANEEDESEDDSDSSDESSSNSSTDSEIVSNKAGEQSA